MFPGTGHEYLVQPRPGITPLSLKYVALVHPLFGRRFFAFLLLLGTKGDATGDWLVKIGSAREPLYSFGE